MNALIKTIITAIIGIFGPLEAEDCQVNIETTNNATVEIIYIDPGVRMVCGFDELSCEKLNNKLSS